MIAKKLVAFEWSDPNVIFYKRSPTQSVRNTPVFSGGTFRIVIRKGVVKIRTRSILFRIARQFQQNKVQIFILFCSRDNRDLKS